MRIDGGRVALESISPELARRIIARDERPGDDWHPDYPFADELVPLRSLAEGKAPDPVFTLYLVRRASDGLAVGGLGFFGPPDAEGRVDIGYGLIADARGAGLATAAVRAALAVAAEHGARTAAADTEEGNRPSQRVLEKAGMVETHRRDGLVFYSTPLLGTSAE